MQYFVPRRDVNLDHNIYVDIILWELLPIK